MDITITLATVVGTILGSSVGIWLALRGLSKKLDAEIARYEKEIDG